MPEQTMIYRPITAADIDVTGYIRKAALEGLERSQGVEPRQRDLARLPHFGHLLRTDPDGAWVAVARGTVIGYAMGFTRGDIWFLAQLFVQPEVHAQGAGRELLRLAMDAGRKRGARVFSVVSSTSPVAQALYMRAGMFATGIGYRLSGSVDALLALPKQGEQHRAIAPTEASLARLERLDHEAFGASRRAEHELYLSDSWGDDRGSGFTLERNGEAAGYGYAMRNGHVGPFAAHDPANQLPLLRIAGEWFAARDIREAYGYFLTHNTTVTAALIAGGWRIHGWSFFLTTGHYGSFDRYVPGSGLLL